MKLDKMQFAMVVGFIQRQFAITINANELAELDNIIDIEVPEPAPYRTNISDINYMLKAICENRRIDAIRAYRNLTGQTLVESKDAVDQYWISKP